MELDRILTDFDRLKSACQELSQKKRSSLSCLLSSQ